MSRRRVATACAALLVSLLLVGCTAAAAPPPPAALSVESDSAEGASGKCSECVTPAPETKPPPRTASNFLPSRPEI